MKSLLKITLSISSLSSTPLMNLMPQQGFQPSPNLQGNQQQDSSQLWKSPWDIRIESGQTPTIIPNESYKGTVLSPLDPFHAPPTNIPKPLTNSPGITQIPGMSLVTSLLTGLFGGGAPKNGIY